jgi:mono/diheme cytochrome c family protein
MKHRLVSTFAAVALITASCANADDDAAVQFERDIRPILAAACVKCHGAKKREGGLRLDAKSFAMTGGDSGPVIRPGKTDDSELLIRVKSDDPDVRMPPEGKRLSGPQIELLTRWIEAGAEWPDDSDRVASTPDHWSFKPVSRPELPDGDEENPIDRFVRARLAAAGLEPNGPADRYTLLRRVSLDLTGLPPSPTEIEQFVSDESPDFYVKLVDRLLGSPHFGEKWSMQWLDLARYADSDGYEKDLPRPHAWRWRNWLIDAINRDLPFDQFSVQQLAGDLLPGATKQVKLATGFHRNTLTNREGGVDSEEFRVKAAVDRINTTMTVWMGLTAGCAQCHTHKYDPITQREFFSLYAFFNNTDEQDLEADLEPKQQAAYDQALAAHDKALKDLQAQLKAEQAAIETRLGDWLAEQRRVLDEKWKPVEVVSRRQSGGPIGGGVLLGGRGQYEVVATTPLSRVIGIRLTVAPAVDRKTDAGFAISHIAVTAKPAGKGETGRLFLAQTRSSDATSPNPSGVLRTDAAGWSVKKQSADPVTLFIGTADKVGAAGQRGNELKDGSQDGATNLLNVFFNSPILGTGTVSKVRVFTKATAGANFGAYLLRRDGTSHRIVYRQDFTADGKAGERELQLNPVWEVQPGDVFAHSGNGGPTFGGGAGTKDVIHYPVSKLPAKGATVDLAKLPKIASRRYSMQVEFLPAAVDYEFVKPKWDDKGAQLTFQLMVSMDLADRLSIAITSAADPLNESLSGLPADIARIVRMSDDERSEAQQKKLIDWFVSQDETGRKLTKQIADHQKKKPKRSVALMHTVKVSGSRPTHVHIRGDFKKKGIAVEPGTPAFLPKLSPRGDRPDRLDLARWVVDPNNPLTARVAVNHIWAQLFGQGLVRTTEDFGTQGEPPTHPVLLDWLASEFPRLDWSRKAMIRLLLLSQTYQQSSRTRAELVRQDPENRLLARQHRFRLEAELVRDQYLAASGLLVRQVGGRSFRPPLPDSVTRVQFVNKWTADSGEMLLRRGLYIHLQRNLILPMLMTFDRPEAILTCTRRDRSNTPLQALTLLNGPVFVESAHALAANIVTDESLTDESRIAQTFVRTVSRMPTSFERNRVKELLAELTAYYLDHSDQAQKLIGSHHAKYWQEANVTPGVAAAWVAITRTLLNLDEMITRE